MEANNQRNGRGGCDRLKKSFIRLDSFGETFKFQVPGDMPMDRYKSILGSTLTLIFLLGMMAYMLNLYIQNFILRSETFIVNILEDSYYFD